MEQLVVRCPGCQKKLLFQEKQRGRRASCPVCRTSVLLAPAPSALAKPELPAITDPFAELAEPSTTNDSGLSADSPGNSRPKSQSHRRKRSKPSREEESDKKGLTGDDRWDENLQSDYGTSGEPYFDELGLDEIAELRSDDWSEPSTLPPVQKRLIRKKKVRKAEPDSEQRTTVRSDTLSSGQDFESEQPLSLRRRISYVVYFLTLLPLGLMILLPRADEQSTVVAEAQNDEEAVADPNGEAAVDILPDGQIGGDTEGEMDDEVEFEPVEFDLDGFLHSLPEHRLHGALLGRDSWAHWLFAALSATGFTVLFLALFRSSARVMGGAVAAAAFTATIGILLLLGLQLAAFASSGFGIGRFGRRAGILTLIFLAVKAIGYSYRCALEPGAGFVSSFMGFTLGVGICEEVCKILPVIIYMATATNVTWQSSCLVGLASGVGFGVSEGITYSSSYYNGISGADMYLVRFISCVALHSVWTGAGAILLYFNQESLQSDWSDIIMILALTLGVPIILHGLYDTLLKQNMPTMALLAAVVSVAWLIGVVEKQAISDAA